MKSRGQEWERRKRNAWGQVSLFIVMMTILCDSASDNIAMRMVVTFVTKYVLF
jgi:hypothetical protein